MYIPFYIFGTCTICTMSYFDLLTIYVPFHISVHVHSYKVFHIIKVAVTSFTLFSGSIWALPCAHIAHWHVLQE